VLNHATLLEKVRLEGIDYLECWIEAKQRKEKKREARQLVQAKASAQQFKRVITSTKRTDLMLENDAEEMEFAMRGCDELQSKDTLVQAAATGFSEAR